MKRSISPQNSRTISTPVGGSQKELIKQNKSGSTLVTRQSSSRDGKPVRDKLFEESKPRMNTK